MTEDEKNDLRGQFALLTREELEALALGYADVALEVQARYDWDHEDSDPDAFDEERALAQLLADDVLFANSRRVVVGSSGGAGATTQETIVLFVLCNDVFVWASADAEPFTLEDLPDLYAAWKKNSTWGPTLWCCKHRGRRPQMPVEKDMRKDGVWEAWLEELPPEKGDTGHV